MLEKEAEKGSTELQEELDQILAGLSTDVESVLDGKGSEGLIASASKSFLDDNSPAWTRAVAGNT